MFNDQRARFNDQRTFNDKRSRLTSGQLPGSKQSSHDCDSRLLLYAYFGLNRHAQLCMYLGNISFMQNIIKTCKTI